MLGAVEHQGSHHVPKSQLSSKCCLFRIGWQNPEINNKPTQVKQPPSAATIEKSHFQDINPLQKWQGRCLGMQVPHRSVLKGPLTSFFPHTLSFCWFRAALERGCYWSWALWTEQHKEHPPAPQWGRLYILHLSLQRLTSLAKLLDLWHPGRWLWGLQAHCPWENGSSITGLWALPTALSCPDTTSAPLLHPEVGNWKKQMGKKNEKVQNKVA